MKDELRAINELMMERGSHKFQLSRIERLIEKKKKRLCENIYQEITNENGPHFSLVWGYAVERNHGMDVSFEEMSQSEIMTYIVGYVRIVYNLDCSFMLIDDDDEDVEDNKEETVKGWGVLK